MIYNTTILTVGLFHLDFSTSLAKVKTLKLERKFLQALKILDDILDDLEPIHKQKRVKLLIDKTNLLLMVGKTEDAEKSALMALDLAKRPPLDVKGQGWALHILGRVNIWTVSQAYKSIKYLKNAIALFSETNDQRGLGISESYLSLAYYLQGDFNSAEQYSKSGLEKIVEFGTEDDITASKTILGIFNMIAGDLQAVESLFQEGVILSEKSGNTRYLSWTLYNLGYALFRCGKSGDVNAIQRSITIMEKYEINVTIQYIIARYILIFVLLAHKKITQAQSEVEKLGKVAEESQLPLAKGYYYLAKGLIKINKHDLGSALELGLKAKEALTHVDYHSGYIEVIKFIIQVQLQLYLSTKEETTKDAIEALLTELELLTEREGIHHAYTEALIIRGLLKKAEFDIPGANKQFKLAETLALKCGNQRLARYAQTEVSQLQKQSSILQRHMNSSPEKFEQVRIQELISYIERAKQQIIDHNEE